MVPSKIDPSAAEEATDIKPFQEPVASHAVDQKPTADEGQTTQPEKPSTTTPESSDKAFEAGAAGAAGEERRTTAEAAEGHQETAGTSAPATGEKEKSPRPSVQTDDDDVNPTDFQGQVLSNDELPSPETIRKIEDYIVLDRHGKSHTFKSLYTGRNVVRRILIIFVRHFFCGNCQEYLRTLCESIKPDSLLHLPISTFIAVVGCGDPGLIDMYASETGCHFPIYADPTRKLYQELGMVKTLALGTRPAYMSKSLLKSSLDSIVQGVKHLRSGLAIRGGDQRQIGGEFLFEPVDIMGPDSSLVQEFDRKLRLNDGQEQTEPNEGKKSTEATKTSRTTSVSDNDNDEVEEPSLVEEKKVTWCHRMRTTRDHAEIPELMEVLGLNGKGKPIKDQKRWSKALETRKGKGLSLASQMSQMSQHKVDDGV